MPTLRIAPAVPQFWLGAHQPSWLGRAAVPMCISHRRLHGRRTFPRALGSWMLDSGGFSELTLFGAWRTTPEDYAEAVARYHQEITQLMWVAPQDWMCEPDMVARTGLSVREHQERSVTSFLRLRALLPQGRVFPVQGWTWRQYQQCVDLYGQAGVDLAAEPLVGVGSICRRSSTVGTALLLDDLADQGLRLHAFGFATRGLQLAAGTIISADSLAWSAAGRRERGCSPGHGTEANCMKFALSWRDRLLDNLRAGAPR